MNAEGYAYDRDVAQDDAPVPDMHHLSKRHRAGAVAGERMRAMKASSILDARVEDPSILYISHPSHPFPSSFSVILLGIR